MANVSILLGGEVLCEAGDMIATKFQADAISAAWAKRL
jgi:hypothetical protein